MFDTYWVIIACKYWVQQDYNINCSPKEDIFGQFLHVKKNQTAEFEPEKLPSKLVCTYPIQ